MAIKKAPDVQITEPAPVTQRIAWWIENSFIRIFKRVFNALKDNVQDLLAYAIGQILDEIEEGLIEVSAPLLNEIQSYDELPNWVQQTISNARSRQHPAALAVLGAIVVALGQILSRGVSDALSPAVTHRLNALFRFQITDPFTSVELFRRGIISEGDLLKLTRANGWPDWLTGYIKQYSEALYDQGELLTGYWRKEVSESQVAEQLHKRGYTNEHIALWKSLSERIPSPAELISIAVREGFDDGVARQFGYDEAFPGEAAEAAEKGGMPTEWFRRLWRAHWRLPSVTQGFDMFHRGIITRDQLDLLLRASDIPSFWRERLVKLSYNVVTRVDVRRMFALGVLSQEDVYNRYLAGGYSPEDAQDLTEWTVVEYAETERELTKAEILGMYKDSVLNENEVTLYLDALGYNTVSIGLLLAREDLKREADYEKQVVASVKNGFMAGVFDETDVRAELGKLDPPAGYVDDTLQLWQLEKTRRLVRPTVTQLRDMWLAEVISDRELDVEMAGRGYSDTYVRWYKTLWTSED